MIEPIELNGDPANADQIAAMLSEMPEFGRVIAYKGSVVAQFTDGEVLIIFNNRGPGDNPEGGETQDTILESGIAKLRNNERSAHPAKPDAPTRSSPIDGTKSNRIPESKSALMINGMGNAYRDSTQLFGEWFSGAGYAVTAVDGTVEGLRTGVHSAGVLYVSTHGGLYPPSIGDFDAGSGNGTAQSNSEPPGDALEHFGLWTRTPVTAAGIDQYRAEIGDGKITYGFAQWDLVNGKPTIEKHFVITEEFVREHWHCDSGALVYIDACSSANARLADVCVGPDVNAAVYLGWTRDVLDLYSTPSARFFFDRALGANQYKPVRTPRQRPFSTSKVLAAMSGLSRLDLPLDASKIPKSLSRVEVAPPAPELAKLVAIYSADTLDVLLRPAIQNLKAADSQGKLTIFGAFGDKPGSVTVDGTPVSLHIWTSDQIECDGPATGPGSSGTVIVESAERESNPRHLTQWDMTFRRTFMDYPTQGGIDCPSCFHDATLHYTFRADTGSVRLSPEGDASPPGYTGGASDASIDVTNAGGTYPIGQGSSITLSPNSDDGAAFVGTCVGFAPPADNNYLGACFYLNGAAEAIAFSPTYVAQGLFRSYTGGAFDGIIDRYSVSYSGNPVGNELVLEYTPNFTITAGNQSTGPNSFFEWDAADAHSPAEPSDPD